jgi:nucleoside-diphosphate-sugar epimerase
MSHMFIFGLGYTGKFVSEAIVSLGWPVMSTGRDGSLAFDDTNAVRLALQSATHIISTIPPSVDGDPVLKEYGADIQSANAWLGYLSSTGVYGDTGGAWVDEAALVQGRRASRNEADLAWQKLGAHVFRLPGIYGPRRSALDRVIENKAHRIDCPDQVFSRIHVQDIVSGVIAAFDARPGVYNLADDHPCSQNLVIEEACRLTGAPLPPILPLDDAGLSNQARAFYFENRRVANGRAKRLLGWYPKFANYRVGLAELALNSE